MELTATEAQEIAMDFLMTDLAIPEEDQEWFAVLSSRFIGESWYVVEIGLEGLPDKWVLQVYDTRECDPNYTFASPIRASDGNLDLEDLPDRIVEILNAERSN
jgi:hypothetical protein